MKEDTRQLIFLNKCLHEHACACVISTLGDCLCIPKPNIGQSNPLFHTFAQFRLIVNRVVAWQATDWLMVNAQFSPNDILNKHCMSPSPELNELT